MDRKKMSGLAAFKRNRQKRAPKWKDSHSQMLIDNYNNLSTKLCKAYNQIMSDTYNKEVPDRIKHKDIETWAKVAEIFSSLKEEFPDITEYQYIDCVLDYYKYRSDLSWTQLASPGNKQIYRMRGEARSKEIATQIVSEVRELYSLHPMMTNESDVYAHIDTNNFHVISKYIVCKKFRLSYPTKIAKDRISKDNGRIYKLKEIIDKLLAIGA